MDKQFWKLQLLKSPAILGMALTLVSTSTAIAIEPETSRESSTTGSSLELQTEFAKTEEVAIAPKAGETKTLGMKAIGSSTLPEVGEEAVGEADFATVEFNSVEFNSAENISRETAIEEMAIEPGDRATIAVESEELEELARAEDEPNIEELLGLSTTPTQIAQVYNPPASNGQVLNRVDRYSNEETNGSLGQGVPGAARFSDVSPSDWAYQALDDLVRRYDCLKGYPNGTYRGNRALTRYEFAAGLNACLQQIERLIAASTADFVTRQDLEALQRLVQEFEAELATLGTRVDNLEGRVAFLEDHQFSTTTKLSGEVIFGLTNNFGGTDTASGVATSVGEAALGDRVRLELNTSFLGNDRLVTRLSAGNLTAFSTGEITTTTPNDERINLDNTVSTSESGSFGSTQTFNVPGTQSNNDVVVDWLAYYFQYLNSQAYVAATGGKWSDIAPTLNPYFEDFDGGDGSISTFSQRNPIRKIGLR